MADTLVTSKEPFQTHGLVDPSIVRAGRSLLDAGLIASADLWSMTPSTNSVGLSWLSESDDDAVARLPRLIVGDDQTAGRGRQGRTWFATKGSLACSLICGCASDLVSLAAGVAVAQTIETLAAPLLGPGSVGLKWPNDVWLGERKTAGILIERSGAHLQTCVIGIGINLTESPILAADSGSSSPTSILEATGRALPRGEVMAELVNQLIEQCQDATDDPAALLRAFRSRCRLSGKTVRVQTGRDAVTGRCTGVDDEGSLVLQTERGRHVCRSGEAMRVRTSSEF